MELSVRKKLFPHRSRDKLRLLIREMFAFRMLEKRCDMRERAQVLDQNGIEKDILHPKAAVFAQVLHIKIIRGVLVDELYSQIVMSFVRNVERRGKRDVETRGIIFAA